MWHFWEANELMVPVSIQSWEILWNANPHHIDGLVQDCSDSIANALESLQSCTKPSIYVLLQNNSPHKGLVMSSKNVQHKYRVYRKISNIRRTLVGNKIVDHSDVVGASPVGAAPTTSSFSTWHLASRDSAKTAASQYENLLSVGMWCALY